MTFSFQRLLDSLCPSPELSHVILLLSEDFGKLGLPSQRSHCWVSATFKKDKGRSVKLIDHLLEKERDFRKVVFLIHSSTLQYQKL